MKTKWCKMDEDPKIEMTKNVRWPEPNDKNGRWSKWRGQQIIYDQK